jgi:alcohol dehydrogenase
MQLEHFIPTRVLFGPGKLEELGKTKLPGKKALIVISNGTSMRKNGYLDRVINLLKKNNVDSVVFDRILPNPINEHVMEGAALAKSEGCDFILGLGGGSSLDSAKSIAIMVNNPGDYWDYISSGSGKGMPIEKPVLPIVAITTTAGTGSEADPWTVITHEKRNEKIGFGTSDTFPALSIVDPELMLTVPPKLTAYQGFDAFFHAAEGVIANIATPVSDIYALKSIELISKYLPTAVNDGKNLDARTNIALSNTLSGFVESTSGCTSEHSLEHAMSAYHPNLEHGAGLIIISVAYFSFFTEYAPERFVLMAKAMGKNVDGVPEKDQPLLFIEALKDLQKKCGVDDLKMSDYGIKETEFDTFAKNAFETMGGLFYLDRHKLNHDDVVKIYKDSFK